MIFDSFPHLRFAQAGSASFRIDGYCHCKTIPFYIFAQAYEGHYEIDAGGKFAKCEEGGAFFVPPNVPLKIWHYVNPQSGVMRIRFVHFIPEDPHGVDPFARFRLRLAITRDECREPEMIMKRLLDHSDRDDFLLASDFLRLLSLFRAFMEPTEAEPYPEPLKRLLQWVHDHASEAIRASDLEAMVPFSRSKLFSLFHEATGMSPGVYILRERIFYAAQRMLREPELSVKEVADRCGWKTAYHFSRLFHRIMGEPPGRYVKKTRLF